MGFSPTIPLIDEGQLLGKFMVYFDAPHAWTDDDVRTLLEGMLIEMHRVKHPDDTERPVALRGLSWIVEPSDEGGVVLALSLGFCFLLAYLALRAGLAPIVGAFAAGLVLEELRELVKAAIAVFALGPAYLRQGRLLN